MEKENNFLFTRKVSIVQIYMRRKLNICLESLKVNVELVNAAEGFNFAWFAMRKRARSRSEEAEIEQHIEI